MNESNTFSTCILISSIIKPSRGHCETIQHEGREKDINTYECEFPKYNDLRFKLNWGEMILHNNVIGF